MMAWVELSGGYSAVIDNDRVEEVSAYVWQVAKCKKPNCIKLYAYGYPKGDSRAKRVGMHHIILGEGGGFVDHINGDGLDNRRENLRRCSARQNAQNSRRFYGASPYKGVTKHYDGRWRARIKINGRNKNLGCFATQVEAARAYDVAALAFFGEFALTNGQIMEMEN